MEDKKRFIVKKKAMKETITVKELKKLQGYSVSPKKDFKLDGMINVTQVTIDNPELIKNYVDKKCKRNMDKILKLLSVITDEDGDDADSPLMLALNEIEKFKQLLIYKYQQYLDKKEYKVLLKKLDILANEIKLRLSIIYEERSYENEKQGRKGR